MGPVVVLVVFGVCVVLGFALKLCACVGVCGGFRWCSCTYCRAILLSCLVVSCQSLVMMWVLVSLLVIAVVRVSWLPVFSSKLCFCSSDGEFRVPVGAGFWCERARVALVGGAIGCACCPCGWRNWLRVALWVARVSDGVSHVSP